MSSNFILVNVRNENTFVQRVVDDEYRAIYSGGFNDTRCSLCVVVFY